MVYNPDTWNGKERMMGKSLNISNHAKERLQSRFGIYDSDSLAIIGSRFADKHQYTIKRVVDTGEELRMISVDGIRILGLVVTTNEGIDVVKTVMPYVKKKAGRRKVKVKNRF
jgi:hypothetical protein